MFSTLGVAVHGLVIPLFDNPIRDAERPVLRSDAERRNEEFVRGQLDRFTHRRRRLAMFRANARRDVGLFSHARFQRCNCCSRERPGWRILPAWLAAR